MKKRSKKGLEIKNTFQLKETEWIVCERKVILRKLVPAKKILVGGEIVATYPSPWPGGGWEEVDWFANGCARP